MGKSQNIIEINGKRYNAATGQLLDGVNAHPVHKPAPVDGFVRRKPSTTRQVAKPAKQEVVQKSKTLMRQAVKKPVHQPSTKEVNRRQIPQGLITPHEVSEERLERAHKTHKSPLISRFSFSNSASHVVKKVAPLHVREQPPAHKPQKSTLAAAVQHHSVSASSSKTHQLVENALAKAQSHAAVAHTVKKRGKIAHKLGLSRRMTAIGTSLVAVLLLGAFFAYQNVPNFAMRVAATRAGFNASMPNYQPSGFSFNKPIKYSPGEVVVSYDSNTADDRSYTITQRKTDWNSDALLANFVLSNDSQYQTFLEPDQTIYSYGEGNATWVEDGIWYKLESKADLTSDQVIRIAESL